MKEYNPQNKKLLDFHDRKKYDLIEEKIDGEFIEKTYKSHNKTNGLDKPFYPVYKVRYNWTKEVNSIRDIEKTTIITLINSYKKNVPMV